VNVYAPESRWEYWEEEKERSTVADRQTKSANLVIDFSGLPKYPETVGNGVNVLREYFLTHFLD